MTTTGRGKAIFCEPSVSTLLNLRLNLMQALRARGFEVVAASPEPEEAERFRALGIRYVRFPANQVGLNPLAEIWTVISLFRLFRRERPTLVHQSTLKMVLYASLAARFAGVPAIINTINGLGSAIGDPKGVMRVVVWLVLLLSRFALRPPVRVCFQNSHLRDFYLERAIVRAEQTAIVPGSGADPNKYRPRSRSGGDDGPLRFLLFSRMIRHKGIEEYCRAAETFTRGRSGGRPVEFVLLGGARPNNPTGVHPEWITNPSTIPGEWLEDEAAKGFVRWMPHKTDVLDDIHAADVVVLPSYYSEGVPRCLIEAMACGKALITTDTPGCRDVVEPGRNGLLVPPQDVAALVDAFQRISAVPGTAEAMGAQSRLLFLERFSDEHIVARTLREYGRAGVRLAERAAAPA